MAWDSSRPVPWRRFMKEWLVYAVVFVVAIFLVRGGDVEAGQFVWVAFTFPVWVGISGLLAKFGYQRKTFREIRAETQQRAAAQQAARTTATSTGRAKPAPTRRTAGGPPNRTRKAKRR